MTSAVRGDLAIVNLERTGRGLPPSEKRWVCQHSCAEDTIPDCSEVNCEAMLVTDSADVAELRRFGREGRLDPFDGVALDFRIAVAPEVATRAAQAIAESPLPMHWRADGAHWRWSGSLLAFAAWLPRMARDCLLSELAKGVGAELRAQFDVASSVLLDQRSVSIGTTPSVGVAAFESRAAYPGIARVAWGVPANGGVRWRDALQLGDGKAGPGFAPVTAWVALEVGEYMGPSARVEAWLDQAAWQRSRDLRDAWSRRGRSNDPTLDCLGFFEALAKLLGLSTEAGTLQGAATATPAHELDYLRPAKFVRGLIDAIALTGKSVA